VTIASGQVPDVVWAQFWAAVRRMCIVDQEKGELAAGDRFEEFLADFQNGAFDFGWDKQSADWKKRCIELNQGRAVQIGLVCQSVPTAAMWCMVHVRI